MADPSITFFLHLKGRPDLFAPIAPPRKLPMEYDKFYYIMNMKEGSAIMVPGQAEITQLMIMLNIFDGVSRPSDISRNIDITLQGVQYHLKILKNRGLVNDDNSISQKGFEYLYSGLNNMRSFVSENIFKLDRVITWEAISRGTITKGDTVYLKMEDGYLSAYGEKVSESRGVSISDSKEGGIVGVTSVEGIIDLEVKGVTIVILPDVEQLYMEAESVLLRVKDQIQGDKADLFAVIGEEALYVSREVGIDNPIKYAPLEASFEAASRGMSATVIVSNRRFRLILEELKALENRNEEVSVRIITI